MNQENKEFQLLDDQIDDKNSVVSFPHAGIFKIGELIKNIKDSFIYVCLPDLGKKLSSKGGIPNTYSKSFPYNWINQGINCEILKEKQGWKKGKVRIKISLEFCPDEPEIKENESPLDQIRQSL